MTNDYLAALGTEQVNDRSKALDEMNGAQIAQLMNTLDGEVAEAVKAALPQIGSAIDAIADRLLNGGRLIYLGAGTSGRLGVLDASECPPTFSAPPELIQGVIAGGDAALRNAIEGAEDNAQMGRDDLTLRGVSSKDAVCAISASGFAPYCIGALEYAASVGALTISLCCNTGAALSQKAQIAIEAPTGAEALSGSTRLKAGTATKMILNMLSTGAMVRLGKVYQNLMVDMSASNSKLRDRAVRILMHALTLEWDEAEKLCREAEGNLKAAIIMHKTGVSLQEAESALTNSAGFVRKAIRALK